MIANVLREKKKKSTNVVPQVSANSHLFKFTLECNLEDGRFLSLMTLIEFPLR